MTKILIADDERTILLMIQRLLNEQGHETCEASNGLAALQLFQTQFFDLVISDLRMPRMDGVSFLHEVKSLDPNVPIIVLTAYATPEILAEANERHAFTYLPKPFHPETLLQTVSGLLSAAVPGAGQTAART